MTLGPILEWLPSETAPSTRPAWVVRGDFILPDDNRIYIPDRRTARAGWGRIGSTHIVDPVERPLPVAMAVTWFSLTEARSYSAQVKLPFDRLVALFTTTLNNTLDDTNAAPDRLIVGLAPGGDVMVWAAGITGTVEVGLWQAAPTELAMHEIIGEGDLDTEAMAGRLLRDNLTKEARAALAKTGPQPGLWRAPAPRVMGSPADVEATRPATSQPVASDARNSRPSDAREYVRSSDSARSLARCSTRRAWSSISRWVTWKPPGIGVISATR